jgi:hypothetical protein
VCPMLQGRRREHGTRCRDGSSANRWSITARAESATAARATVATRSVEGDGYLLSAAAAGATADRTCHEDVLIPVVGAQI